MHENIATQRKAAILLASLDPDTADALIEQMPPEEARQVRDLLMSLEDVTLREQDVVIQEFFRAGEFTPSAPRADEAIGHESVRRLHVEPELDAAPFASPGETFAPADATDRASARDSRARPFAFLQDAASDALTPYLESEHPQTIALVLAHLEPGRAAGVLRRMSPAVQADVIRRLVDLGEADPEALREVEQGLLTRIGAAPLGRRREYGLDKVAAILESSSRDDQRDMIHSLSMYAPKLGVRLQPPEFSFADLTKLDDWALAEVLAAADPDVIVLALAGATAEFTQNALRRLPSREARLVRQALRNLGPTRLSDLEQAQQELAELAQRLESQGRLSLPNGRRLSLTG